MKKMFRKVSAAAMSAAMVLGNGVMFAANAEDAAPADTTSTVIVESVEATSTEAVSSVEATSSETASAEVTTTATEATTAEVTTTVASQGFVAGTFYSTSANYQGYNTYSFASDGKSGSYTNSVSGASVNFTASYANGVLTVNYSDGSSKTGNVSGLSSGAAVNQFTITWNSGEVETFSATVPATASTTSAASVTTTSAAKTSAGSTTAAGSTTKAATTTAKVANKNDSPKTGDSFPALAMTAALLSAAALSITTKKRSK